MVGVKRRCLASFAWLILCTTACTAAARSSPRGILETAIRTVSNDGSWPHVVGFRAKSMTDGRHGIFLARIARVSQSSPVIFFGRTGDSAATQALRSGTI